MPSILNATTNSGLVTSADNSGSLQLQTNNGTTAVTIDTSQRVGIGTTSPARILDVAAPNTGAGAGLRITSTTGTNGSLMQLSNTGGNLYYAIDNSTGGSFGSAYSANVWYDGNYPMRFAVANQTQMIINGAGEFQMNSGYGSVATAYGCRAWVNFNGTGTPAIRASGNVSSLTDIGTGTYNVNFATALPDANYSVQANVTDDSTANRGINVQGTFGANQTTSTVRVTAYAVGTGGQDPQGVFVAIFR